MKITRTKKVAKIIGFYKKHFGFFDPYNILIDGVFCNYALQNQVDISLQLPKYFGCEVKILTTPCCIVELERVKQAYDNMRGAWLILKKYPTHKCGHEKNPIESSECIKSMLKENNPSHYIIGTVDDTLREEIRNNWDAAPILFLSRSAPSLEKPNKFLKAKINENSDKTMSETQVKELDALKLALGITKKKKKDTKRKRLTGAEIKRKKKTKQLAKEERRKEFDRSVTKMKIEELELKNKQKVTVKRDYKHKLDIDSHITSVLG